MLEIMVNAPIAIISGNRSATAVTSAEGRRGAALAAIRTAPITARKPSRLAPLVVATSMNDFSWLLVAASAANAIPGLTAAMIRAHAGPDTEVRGQVADGTGHVPEYNGVGPGVCMRGAGDPPEGPLESDQAVVSGRDAQRTTPVASSAEADEAAGHRRSRPSGRTAGRATPPPRVVGDTVQLGHRYVQAAELAGGREADGHDAAPAEQPFEMAAGVVGDPVLEHQGALGVGPALQGEELLDAG